VPAAFALGTPQLGPLAGSHYRRTIVTRVVTLTGTVRMVPRLERTRTRTVRVTERVVRLVISGSAVLGLVVTVPIRLLSSRPC
jgi:hypothetical protein